MLLLKALLLLRCTHYLRAGEVRFLGIRAQNNFNIDERSRHRREQADHELIRGNENDFYNELRHANEDNFLQIVRSGSIRPELLNTLIPVSLAANYQSVENSGLVANLNDSPNENESGDRLFYPQTSQHDHIVVTEQFLPTFSLPISFQQGFDNQKKKTPISSETQTSLSNSMGNNTADQINTTPSNTIVEDITKKTSSQASILSHKVEPMRTYPFNFMKNQQYSFQTSSTRRPVELPISYPVLNPFSLSSLNLNLQPGNLHNASPNRGETTTGIFPSNLEQTNQANNQVRFETVPKGNVILLVNNPNTKVGDSSDRRMNLLTSNSKTAETEGQEMIPVFSTDATNKGQASPNMNRPYLGVVPNQFTSNQLQMLGGNNFFPFSFVADFMKSFFSAVPRIVNPRPIKSTSQQSVFVGARTIDPAHKSIAAVRSKIRVLGRPGQHLYQFKGAGIKKPVYLLVGPTSAAQSRPPAAHPSSAVRPGVYAFQSVIH